MTFIMTLISLIIERFFHWSHLRYWKWFGIYQNAMYARIGKIPAYLFLVICILPLLVAVGVVNCLLSCFWYGILKMLFGIIILTYCLGPENLWAQIYACLGQFNKEDPKAALESVRAAFGIVLPENSQALHEAFTRAIFVEANQRIFAVVFWFVLLGPVGAVLYRTIYLLAKDSAQNVMNVAERVKAVLDWIPARIFVLIFALSGHFTNVFAVLKQGFKNGLNSSENLIADCGIAALGLMRDNRIPEEGASEKAALSLLDRSFVITLVLLALIVLMR